MGHGHSSQSHHSSRPGNHVSLPGYFQIYFLICSFMGLSQTLPVTSYFKMIDIWMLFTMTVPFLEVVLHTTKEVFKKSKVAPACLNKLVDVVNVKPAEDQEVT